MTSNRDNLAVLLSTLYPQFKNGVDFIVQDNNDGQGKKIVKWPNGTPQPNEDDVMAQESAILSQIAEQLVTKQKDEAELIVTSNDPHARTMRAIGRIVMASIAQKRAAFNQLLTILKNKSVLTQGQVDALTLPVRTWKQLLDAARQTIADESDPNT